MCEEAQSLLEEPYRELFNKLKTIIHTRVTDTESRQGQWREAVIFQIDHGTGHLNRVCRNMAIMLKATQKEIPLEDRFAALCAAAFHDLGMHFGWELLQPPITEPPSPAEAAIIRKNHAWIGGRWFRSICLESPPEMLRLGLSGQQLRLLQDPLLNTRISFAIEAHGLSDTDLNAKLADESIEEQERQRIRFLACALTVADTLDMDSRRVPYVRMEDAARHWQGHTTHIQPAIEDLSRFLMLHYMGSAHLQKRADTTLLEFFPQPVMPGGMLYELAYKPFREHLLNKYRQRLRPSDPYHQRILKDYAGIDFVSIDVPPFSHKLDAFPLDKDLLQKIMVALGISGAGQAATDAAPEKESYEAILDWQKWTAENMDAPSILLRPEFQTVPFHDARAEHLQEILSWAEEKNALYPTVVRLLTGGGGAGKTRLLLEVCARLRTEGWLAGFLPYGRLEKHPSLLDNLAKEPTNILMVLDYAESRRGELVDVLRAAVGNAAKRRFCVVLLARGAGDWWDRRADYLNEDPKVEAILRGAATSGPYLLTAKPLELPERNKIYQDALAAFANKLEKKVSSLPLPDLVDVHFAKILYIHMAALAFLLQDVVSLAADDLLELILSHERNYWHKCGQEAGFSERMVDGIAQTMLQFTLAGGVESSKGAKKLIQRTPQPRGWNHQEQQELFKLLRRLYPQEGGGITALEPDLLGEHLVAQGLKGDQEPLEVALEKEATDAAAVQALTVLNRLAARRADQSHWLEQGLTAHLSTARAEQAIQVAVASGDPIGRVLAGVLEKKRLPAVIDNIVQRRLIPDKTVALLELALVVTRQRHDRLKQHGQPKELHNIRIYASSCYEYGVALASTGKVEDSLSLFDESIKYWGRIQHKHIGYKSNYLLSLTKKAASLSMTGDNEKALVILENVLKRRKNLAETCDDRNYQSNLAFSINNYGTSLSNMGRWSESVDYYRQAVVQWEKLGVLVYDEQIKDGLSIAKEYLSGSLMKMGRLKESLASGKEALSGFQELSTINRDAYLPFLAEAQGDLGELFLATDHFSLALQLAKEHQKTDHFLFQNRQKIFKQDYVWAQLLLADIYLEQEEQALLQEAIRGILPLARELFAEQPMQGKPHLADTLYAHATALLHAEGAEAALPLAEESVNLFEQLHSKNPPVYAHMLALALALYGRSLHGVGRVLEAKDAIQKALVLLTPHYFDRPLWLHRQMRRVAKTHLAITGTAVPGEVLALMTQTEEHPERIELRNMQEEDLFPAESRGQRIV